MSEKVPCRILQLGFGSHWGFLLLTHFSLFSLISQYFVCLSGQKAAGSSSVARHSKYGLSHHARVKRESASSCRNVFLNSFNGKPESRVERGEIVGRGEDGMAGMSSIEIHVNMLLQTQLINRRHVRPVWTCWTSEQL